MSNAAFYLTPEDPEQLIGIASSVGLHPGNDDRLYLVKPDGTPIDVGATRVVDIEAIANNIVANGPVIRVAASDATDEAKRAAKYVCDGDDDQEEIQQAIDDVADTGGTVMLSSGQFEFTAKVTINNDGVRLIGEGGDRTILFTSWANGDPIVHFIEIKGTDDTTKISRNEIAHLSFVSDAPYSTTPTGFIGHAPIGKTSGVLRGIWAQYVSQYRLHHVYGKRVSFISDTRNANNVTITDVKGTEIFGAVSLVRVTRSVVADIDVELSETVVDLGACQYAAIVNVAGKNSTVRNTDELIDIGGSQYVAISNCVSDGYYRGIHIKYEAGDVAESSSITIANCVIRGNTASGILLNNVGQTGTRQGPFTITNCLIESTVSGSSGVLATNNMRDVIVSGNVANVHGSCIQLDGCTNSLIAGNKVGSSNGVAIRANKTSTPVSQCMHIVDNIISSGTNGIWCSSATEPMIVNNTITGCSAAAIWCFECARPNVRGNTIRRVATHGVHIEWNTLTNVDSTRYLGFVCDDNCIQDFSRPSAGSRAIWLEATGAGITGDSLDVGSISNNMIFATSDGQTTVNAIRVEIAVNLDYVMICGNTVSPNLSNGYVKAGSGVLESNCKIKNNIGIADV